MRIRAKEPWRASTCVFREMSEEEVEEEFSDAGGEEGNPPAAEWGVPPLDAWIVELVAKVGASRKLSEADQLRLPTALTLGSSSYRHKCPGWSQI